MNHWAQPTKDSELHRILFQHLLDKGLPFDNYFDVVMQYKGQRCTIDIHITVEGTIQAYLFAGPVTAIPSFDSLEFNDPEKRPPVKDFLVPLEHPNAIPDLITFIRECMIEYKERP